MAVVKLTGRIPRAKLNSAKATADIRITTAVANKIKGIKTQDWIYVAPTENKWTVRMDGAHRVKRIYKQKVSALNAAKRLLDISDNGQIIVYNSLGEISKVI